MDWEADYYTVVNSTLILGSHVNINITLKEADDITQVFSNTDQEKHVFGLK